MGTGKASARDMTVVRQPLGQRYQQQDGNGRVGGGGGGDRDSIRTSCGGQDTDVETDTATADEVKSAKEEVVDQAEMIRCRRQTRGQRRTQRQG